MAGKGGNRACISTALRRVAVLVVLAVSMSGCVRGDLEYLASDASDGRDNGTAGSVHAQDYLLRYLTPLTVGTNSAATGTDTYKQAFSGGTNVIGVLPGSDLADQYVLVLTSFSYVLFEPSGR